MSRAAAECRVLLVEDDADTRDIMVRLIRHVGCDVRSAATVAAAVAILDRWTPTDVLLDLMLPDGVGTLFLRHVRRAQLPVRVALVTAAGAESRLVADAMALQPDALFHKPVQFPEVEAWLRA